MIRILTFLILSAPVLAQYIELEKEQLVHRKVFVQFNFDPHIKKHDLYAKIFEADWNVSWYQRLNREHWEKCNDTRREFLTKYCEKMDEKVALLKQEVTLEVLRDPTAPSPAYRWERYHKWIPIEEPLVMLPGFYLRFAEWAYSDWNHEADVAKYLECWEYHDMYYWSNQAKHLQKFVVQWVKDNSLKYGIVEDQVGWVYVNGDGYISVFDKGERKYKSLIKLEETTFRPLPAVAWSRPPQLIPNPLKSPYILGD